MTNLTHVQHLNLHKKWFYRKTYGLILFECVGIKNQIKKGDLKNSRSQPDGLTFWCHSISKFGFQFPIIRLNTPLESLYDLRSDLLRRIGQALEEDWMRQLAVTQRNVKNVQYRGQFFSTSQPIKWFQNRSFQAVN